MLRLRLTHFKAICPQRTIYFIFTPSREALWTEFTHLSFIHTIARWSGTPGGRKTRRTTWWGTFSYTVDSAIYTTITLSTILLLSILFFVYNFVSTLCTYELSFLCSSIYVFPFLVIFMSWWFVAYSCDSFVSFLRSNTMSHASQSPLRLPQQWCLTHRKYSVNILWLMSTEQNNSLRIHIKSSWAISRWFPLSYTIINLAILMQDIFSF